MVFLLLVVFVGPNQRQDVGTPLFVLKDWDGFRSGLFKLQKEIYISCYCQIV